LSVQLIPITDRTFAFAVRIVKLARYLDNKPGISQSLAKQLLHSGTAIGLHIEEALNGQSNAEFVSNISTALKKARETLYWLKLLVASDLCDAKQLTKLTHEANQIVSILVTSMGEVPSTPETNNRKS